VGSNRFGENVLMSSDARYVFVGDPRDSSNAGAVRIFGRTSTALPFTRTSHEAVNSRFGAQMAFARQENSLFVPIQAGSDGLGGNAQLNYFDTTANSGNGGRTFRSYSFFPVSGIAITELGYMYCVFEFSGAANQIRCGYRLDQTWSGTNSIYDTGSFRAGIVETDFYSYESDGSLITTVIKNAIGPDATWVAFGLPGYNSKEGAVLIHRCRDFTVAIGSDAMAACRSSTTSYSLMVDGNGALNDLFTIPGGKEGACAVTSFGFSVDTVMFSPLGIVVAASAPHDACGRGSVFIMRMQAITGGVPAYVKLTPPNRTPAVSTKFGSSIAFSSDGSHLAIGVETVNGAVLVYDLVGGTWRTIIDPPTYTGYLGQSQRFGSSVSMNHDGTWLVVGQPNNIAVPASSPTEDPNAGTKGRAHIYTITPSIAPTWRRVFLRIKAASSGDHYLNLNEVRVFAGGVNVALWRPSALSSTYLDGTYSDGPVFSNDGSTSKYFHSEMAVNDVLIIDLGNVSSTITSVEIVNRPDATTRFVGATVSLCLATPCTISTAWSTTVVSDSASYTFVTSV
jgi:hypothetical protein